VTTHSTTPFLDPHEFEEAWSSALAEKRGGSAYGALIGAQRLLQDRISGAVLPGELVGEVTSRLDELAAVLGEHQAPESERWDGWRPDLPGRAMPLLPPFVIDHLDERELRGRVTFTRFYLGGNGAAHGGTHTLLFDDVMGELAAQPGGMARTASLTVNYRRITPIDVELRFEARLDRVEDRKRYVTAQLYNPAGEVLADCTALFLQLLSGQQ
jgi:acyl-coenzyme A thioesterase PaaI-like protein